MCKYRLFESSETKNELFKVQGQKTNFIKILETKTIVYPMSNNPFISMSFRCIQNGNLVILITHISLPCICGSP